MRKNHNDILSTESSTYVVYVPFFYLSNVCVLLNQCYYH